MALSKIQSNSYEDTAVHGQRNLIINGAMQVWQRGTTKSLTTSDYFIADRWINYIGTGGAGTASQQVFTLGQTDVEGEPEYYLRHAQTTGASSAPNVQHRIEGVRTGAGQSVTLSFYAKVASSTLTIDPIIRQYFGTGGSPSSTVDHTPTDITVTTSWQKFERTVALTSINGKTIGTDGTDSLQIRLQLPTSTTFTLDIAQVQLEIGEQATPFEHRSYGDELARCQRYYYQLVQGSYMIVGMNDSTSNCETTLGLPVEMRVDPTLGTSGTPSQYTIRQNGSNITCDSGPSVLGGGGKQVVGIRFTKSAALNTSFASYCFGNTSGADLKLDAEL